VALGVVLFEVSKKSACPGGQADLDIVSKKDF